MSTDPTDPTRPGQPGQPSEEEMRAAYEAEIKRLRVEDVLVQTLVSLINLGGRKAGLAEGTEDERDPQQLQMAVDAALAILPVVEPILGQDAGQVRNAISQLQMAFAQMAGGAQPAGGAADPSGEQPQQPQGPGQPPSSGRLWVPGQ
jgi:hypothetical protein